MDYYQQSSKFEFTGPNQILEFIFIKFKTKTEKFPDPNQILEFIFIKFKTKTEKFTGPNKVLLVLGWRTSVHRED